MEINNSTPFTFAPLAGRLGFPAHSMTCIVKGTYQLHADGDPTWVDDPAPPHGDLHYETATGSDATGNANGNANGSDAATEPTPAVEETLRAPRYESDLAYHKPFCDVFVVGHAHAPGGQPQTQFDVGIAIERDRILLDQRLCVLGERHWQGGWVRVQATAPLPFTTLPLRYEHAFGGPTHESNPVGMGLERLTRGGDTQHPLPRIEHPQHRVESIRSRPKGAGFGPIPRTWKSRQHLLGSFDKSWQKTRWPWYPADFDPRHFNAAPEELQIDGYLHGGEQVTLTNLHREYEVFRTRLPDDVPTLRVLRAAGGEEKLQLNLDTAWFDMENELLVLVWRGSTETTDADFSDIAAVEISSQRFPPVVAGAIPPAEVASDSSEPLSEESVESDSPRKPTTEPALDESLKEIFESLSLTAAGFESAVTHHKSILPHVSDEELRHHIGEFEAKWNAAAVDTKGDKDGGTEGAHGDAEDTVPGSAPTAADSLSLREQIEAIDSSPERAARIEELLRQHARDEGLTGLDLSDLDFSDCDLSGLDFSQSQLHGCNFSHSTLSDADFSECSLADSDLFAAIATNSSFEGADLNGTSFCEGVLTQSNFSRTHGAAVDFAAATLVETRFHEAQLEQASFSGARLDRADFNGAELPEVTLEQSHGSEVIFRGANLTSARAEGGSFVGADFYQSTAPSSNFSGADLSAADLRFSDFDGSLFIKTKLTEARLRGCRMSSARFDGAHCRRVVATGCNLMHASFLGADLTDSCFDDSNLYGALLLESKRDGMSLERCHTAAATDREPL